jgi:hypothetical protein
VYRGKSEFIFAVYLTLSMLLASHKYDAEQMDTTAAKSPKEVSTDEMPRQQKLACRELTTC